MILYWIILVLFLEALVGVVFWILQYKTKDTINYFLLTEAKLVDTHRKIMITKPEFI